MIRNDIFIIIIINELLMSANNAVQNAISLFIKSIKVC